MAEQFVIEGYTQLVRDLKKYAPEVAKQYTRDLKGIAASTAATARGNASWSTRIPGAIGVSATNKGAALKVSRRKAPHGSLYERGPKGGGNTFRHPVFGNREVWVTQSTRPFLKPAIDVHYHELIRDGEQALRRALKTAGLA